MHPYVSELNNLFMEHADANYASSMKKYMKGQFEYYGIRSPLRKELGKTFVHRHGIPDVEQFEEVIFDLWKVPQREAQYFAMELAGKLAREAEMCRVDLYEYMASDKSWWDTIDYIASNLVGVHFKKFPDAILPYTQGWMESGNMWLQRICILFQLKYKQSTDLELLTEFIDQLEGSKEFFINKAIGWILREYSKTNAPWVVEYVSSNADHLAPLSKREALKWLNNNNYFTDDQNVT